ncbi:MAG: 3'-5' exonuclease [FCB group bacterium]|nr:3'-5' exonuclease [FCB group bacterium]
MKLKIERPILFFDLETTGTDTENDRIVQIACVRISESGHRYEYVQLVNPCRPIPKEATEVHGITDEMVSNKPQFREISQTVCEIFDGANIGGYNIKRFDIPLLMNELQRCGAQIDVNVAIVDVMEVFHQREPRDLEAALKFYCGKTYDNAHDALADVVATIDVLEGQLKRYDDLPHTAAGIHNETRDPDAVDLAGKLRFDENGEMTITFGKHKGQKLRDIPTSYLSWMMNNNVIGPDASNVIDSALSGHFYKKN